MVLLENFRAEPITDNFLRLIVVSSCSYCHEWLRTYDAAHSKVRKENHPERAEDKKDNFLHLLYLSQVGFPYHLVRA